MKIRNIQNCLPQRCTEPRVHSGAGRCNGAPCASPTPRVSSSHASLRPEQLHFGVNRKREWVGRPNSAWVLLCSGASLSPATPRYTLPQPLVYLTILRFSKGIYFKASFSLNFYAAVFIKSNIQCRKGAKKLCLLSQSFSSFLQRQLLNHSKHTLRKNKELRHKKILVANDTTCASQALIKKLFFYSPEALCKARRVHLEGLSSFLGLCWPLRKKWVTDFGLTVGTVSFQYTFFTSLRGVLHKSTLRTPLKCDISHQAPHCDLGTC